MRRLASKWWNEGRLCDPVTVQETNNPGWSAKSEVDSPSAEEDAQRAAQQALIGQVLGGRYTITKLLGEGGMGAVFVGEQKLGGTIRKVAIKTLHPHLSHDPKILARFERECGTIAELQHPNTIQVYDFGKTDNGLLYIAMEFVEGRSVAEILEKDGPMDPPRVLKILEQVCGSLEEAHGRGIVHRDLKPDNIVLCERAGQKDWVEVLDFGIAKRSSEEDKNEQKLTQQGMVLGTPPYMSPEQFTGKPIDARSDIYSLGVMTYEMLTGRLPFTGNTAWEWATQHMTMQPQPFEAQPLGARVPPDMRHAVTKSLAKLPEDRFANVREFIDAFSGRKPVADPNMHRSTGTAANPVVDPHAVQGGYTGAPAAGSPPRAKTEIGAPVDAMPYGAPAPVHGGTPMGYGHGAPPMAVAAGPGYGTPASGNQAFVANQHHQAYGNTASDGGGGKRGLLIAGLAAALLGCVALVLWQSGVFSSSPKVTPLGGDRTSTTTAPTNTVVAPPDTPTTPTTPGTLPALTTTPVNTKPTTPVTPKVDAGQPPTTTATAPTTTPPATTTAPPATTTPPTATTPPIPTPKPTTPPAPTEPPECAQARTACAGGGMAQRAMCGQLKQACFSKGGKL